MVSKDIQIKVLSSLAGNGLNTAVTSLKNLSTGSKSTEQSLQGLSSVMDSISKKSDATGKSLDNTSKSLQELGNKSDSAASSTSNLESAMDNVSSSTTSVSGTVDSLKDGIGDLESVTYNVSGSFGSFDDTIESAGSSLGSIEGNINSLSGGMGDLQGEVSSTSTSFGYFDSAIATGRSAVESIKSGLSNLGSTISSIGSKATQLGSTFSGTVISGLQKTKDAASGLKETFSGLGGVMASVLGGMTLNSLVQSGVEAEKKWTNIAANVGMNLADMGGYKKQVFQTAQKWGVNAGELGNGVKLIAQKYGDINKAMSYSNGLAATSVRMGITSEEVANALFKAEMGKTMALKGKVLTVDQYNRYLEDGKLTEEEIGQVMKENELIAAGMTETAAAKMAKVDNSVNKLKTTLGSSLLPILQKLTDGVQWLADGFNGLPGPVKDFTAYLVAGGLALVTFGAPLALAASLLKKMGSSALTLGKYIGKAVTKMWEYVAAEKVANKNTPKGTTLPGGTGGKGLTAAGLVTAAVTGGVVVAAVAAMAGIVYGNSTLTPKQRSDAHKKDMGLTKPAEPNTPGGAGYVDPNPANLTPKQTKSRDFWNNPFKDFKLPTFTWPVIPNPFEGWTWPTFTWPQVSIPQWHWPSFNWPHVTIPQWHWPSFNWPHISIPSASQILAAITGHGPRGSVNTARGRGIPGLHYENYAGHQKDAWNSAGTCLTGNCVDMTLGLMSRYGGGMVAGTWNGGPHVWWQAPSGQQLDPARKALDGTWTPPARGPHDPSFGNTIIIQGDIYGFEDFKKKVEDANAKIFYDAARF